MAPGSVKAVVSVPVDGLLAADRMVVTPHFAGADITTAFGQAVADTLAPLVATYITTSKEVRVTTYKDVVPGTKGNYPLGTKTVNAGNVLVSHAPREVALALSFYCQGLNRPRYRGRLYIPWEWIYYHTGSTLDISSRPTSAQQTAVQQFATACLLPLTSAISATWGVYSAKDNLCRAVSNYYTDDEWDTQRRRGRKPTARTAAVVP